MSRYHETGNDKEQNEKQVTGADRTTRLMDKFLGEYMHRLPPEELKKAIVENTDPREAWRHEPRLRQEMLDEIGDGTLAAAQVGSFFSSVFTNKTLSERIYAKYATLENITRYLEFYKHKYPAHYDVIYDLQPRSLYYLQSCARILLKDLLG